MLSTTFLDHNLPTCIYNASGPKCTHLTELISLAQCPYTAATLTKSTTLLPREGNPHPRYWESDISSVNKAIDMTINSTGLANVGYQAYGEYAQAIKEINARKPYIVSMAGLSMADNLTMIKYYNDLVFDKGINNIDAIELNLSCPNVIGKPQIGYDMDVTEDILRRIYDDSNSSLLSSLSYIPIGLKMPPYFDQIHISNMADLLNQFPICSVTCINSLGNGLVIDPIRECPVIKPKNGLGGIGGEIVLPFALSNVYQFRNSLSDHIDVIGCGGISTGSHAFQHLLVGATMIQVGSAYMRNDISCFQSITQELETLMKSKNYNHVSEFRGNFKQFIDE